ncbi:MAG TPA: lmo0937 family membrane protein [Blastocatellia bacterium]|nr:lmo0937 family membrane protein [Blastocatellia bacterium]
MLWGIFIFLIVLWLLGLVSGIGGSLIHALLVIALCIYIYNMFRGAEASFSRR